MARRLRAIRHDSDSGTWELVRSLPAPGLRRHVVEYEGYVERGATEGLLRQQVPTTVVPLILNFGSSWAAADEPGGRRELHDSFVAGLHEHSTYVAASGPASCVQVNLTPLGAHTLLGAPMSELANRIVSVDAVASTLAPLVDRLEERDSWETRFELLDDFLARRLANAREPTDDVAWAWAALERTDGRAPIGWICDRLGRSRRHLAARFRDEIGLPPKTVARIMRFDRAVARIGGGGTTLAEVAFECGYFDQAHMNRDFRQFAGMSPAAFAPHIAPTAGFVV